jgi:hypothetical protein
MRLGLESNEQRRIMPMVVGALDLLQCWVAHKCRTVILAVGLGLAQPSLGRKGVAQHHAHAGKQPPAYLVLRACCI